jgi:hypothetical protein|tara:strand:- start:865 stop:1065 length:201 start_codon:yes stop_codon:yes gene_type:complete
MNVYAVMKSRRRFMRLEGTDNMMFLCASEEDAIKQVAQLEKDRDDELMRTIDGYYYEVMEVKKEIV